MQQLNKLPEHLEQQMPDQIKQIRNFYFTKKKGDFDGAEQKNIEKICL